MARMNFATALTNGLRDALQADERASLIGSYVLGLGPLRHLMDQVRAEFHDRVLDPPTAEAGAAATAVGAAMAGMRPFVDLGTASFSYLAWSQLVNEAAVARYMSNGKLAAPVTFHMLAGVRGGGAPQHSNSPQAMLCNAPGLEIVAPAIPEDAYGLIRAAFESDNPTVVVSHAKLLAMESDVPESPEPGQIGKAAIRRSGKDVTIVATSLMVPYSLDAAEALAGDGIAAEVVDMRTLVPLDRGTLLESVGRTGRLVVVDECPLHCGYASEIAATVAEHGFDLLDKPIQRVTRAHVPVPYNAGLEAAVTPDADKIAAAVRRIAG